MFDLSSQWAFCCFVSDVRPDYTGSVLYVVEGAPNSAVRMISLYTHTVTTICDTTYQPDRQCVLPGQCAVCIIA